MKKGIISKLIVIITALTLITGMFVGIDLLGSDNTARAETATIDGVMWNYTVVDGKATNVYTISYLPTITSSGSQSIAYIPGRINGYEVVSLGGGTEETSCFRQDFNRQLAKIYVPDTVVAINNYAFKLPNASFKVLQFYDSDVTYNETAVRGDTEEKYYQYAASHEVSMPHGSFISIGASAFEGNATLESMHIPAGVAIGANAFKDCVGLKKVQLDGNNTLGKEAFAGTSGLETLLIGEGCNIGESAFENATSLETLYVPASTNLGAYAFKGCIGLKNLEVGIETISSQFNDCPALENIVLDETVDVVESNAFQVRNTTPINIDDDDNQQLHDYIFDMSASKQGLSGLHESETERNIYVKNTKTWFGFDSYLLYSGGPASLGSIPLIDNTIYVFDYDLQQTAFLPLIETIGGRQEYAPSDGTYNPSWISTTEDGFQRVVYHTYNNYDAINEPFSFDGKTFDYKARTDWNSAELTASNTILEKTIVNVQKTNIVTDASNNIVSYDEVAQELTFQHDACAGDKVITKTVEVYPDTDLFNEERTYTYKVYGDKYYYPNTLNGDIAKINLHYVNDNPYSSHSGGHGGSSKPGYCYGEYAPNIIGNYIKKSYYKNLHQDFVSYDAATEFYARDHFPCYKDESQIECDLEYIEAEYYGTIFNNKEIDYSNLEINLHYCFQKKTPEQITAEDPRVYVISLSDLKNYNIIGDASVTNGYSWDDELEEMRNGSYCFSQNAYNADTYDYDLWESFWHVLEDNNPTSNVNMFEGMNSVVFNSWDNEPYEDAIVVLYVDGFTQLYRGSGYLKEQDGSIISIEDYNSVHGTDMKEGPFDATGKYMSLGGSYTQAYGSEEMSYNLKSGNYNPIIYATVLPVTVCPTSDYIAELNTDYLDEHSTETGWNVSRQAFAIDDTHPVTITKDMILAKFMGGDEPRILDVSDFDLDKTVVTGLDDNVITVTFEDVEDSFATVTIPVFNTDLEDMYDDFNVSNISGLKAEVEQLVEDYEEANESLGNYLNVISAIKRQLDEEDLTTEEQAALETSLVLSNNKVAAITSQIETLQSTLAAKIADLEAATTRIAQLEAAKTTNEARISELEGIVGEKDETIAANEERIAQLEAVNTASAGTIEELNGIIASRNSTIASLNETISGLEGNITTKDQTIASLNETIAGLTSQNTTLTGRVSELEATKSANESTIAELNATISANNTTISELNATIEGLENDIATRDQTIASLNSTIAGLNTQVSSLTERVNELETTILSNNARIEELEGIIAEKDTTIEGLEAQNGTLTETIATKEQAISDLNGIINDKNATIGTLNTTISELESGISTKDQTIASLNSTIGDLTSQNTALTGRISELESTQSANESTINELSGIIEDNNQTIASLNTTIAGLESSNGSKDQTIVSLNSTIAGLNTQVSDLTRLKTEYESELETLRGQNTTLNGQVTSLNSSIKSARQRIAELEALNERIVEALTDIIKDVNSGAVITTTDPLTLVAQLESEIESLKARLSSGSISGTIAEQIRALGIELGTTTDRTVLNLITAIKNKNTEINNLKANSGLKIKYVYITTPATDTKETREALDGLVKENEKLTNENTTLATKLSTLSTNLDIAEEEKQTLTTEIGHLKETIEDQDEKIETLSTDLKTIKTESEGKDKEIDALTGKVKTLNSDIDDLTIEVNKLKTSKADDKPGQETKITPAVESNGDETPQEENDTDNQVDITPGQNDLEDENDELGQQETPIFDTTIVATSLSKSETLKSLFDANKYYRDNKEQLGLLLPNTKSGAVFTSGDNTKVPILNDVAGITLDVVEINKTRDGKINAIINSSKFENGAEYLVLYRSSDNNNIGVVTAKARDDKIGFIMLGATLTSISVNKIGVFDLPPVTLEDAGIVPEPVDKEMVKEVAESHTLIMGIPIIGFTGGCVVALGIVIFLIVILVKYFKKKRKYPMTFRML